MVSGECLVARGVTKRFAGVVAVNNLSLEVRAGEIRALCGENGSGKSTFCGVVGGKYVPNDGEVFIDGERMVHFSPSRARKAGVGVVFQDLSLVPQLSIAENLWLSSTQHQTLVRRGRMRDFAKRALDAVETELPLEAPIKELSRSDQTMVEAAKVAIMEPKIAIFDEPTAALAEDASGRMLDLIRRLKQGGAAILFVTHRLREIWEIADTLTVLREGMLVASSDPQSMDEAGVIQTMANRSVASLYPRADVTPGEVALSAEDVSGPGVASASIEVREGEIVGLAGLVASGKAPLGGILAGLRPASEGRIRFGARAFPADKLRPRAALNAGVAYYPADRRGAALFLSRPIRENLTISALDGKRLSRRTFIRRKEELSTARGMADRLSIRPPNIERETLVLSGGNQQKIVVGRALVNGARIHIFDEPTMGVDVNAKVEIYTLLKEFCEQGCAILLISSDLLEVVHLSHRVYVMHEGKISAHLQGDEITEENTVRAMFGHSVGEVAIDR